MSVNAVMVMVVAVVDAVAMAAAVTMAVTGDLNLDGGCCRGHIGSCNRVHSHGLTRLAALP